MKEFILYTVGFLAPMTLAIGATSCKELTPQQESVLTKASATILCAMEGEMLDDPALNKACEEILPNLAPEQRAAVQAHITARKAKRSFTDAGTPLSEPGSPKSHQNEVTK